MDAAGEIWNRAADPDFQPSLPGDIALATLAMNGGLVHSLEVDLGQGKRAAEGFRWLGATDLGLLVDEACEVAARRPEDSDFDIADLGEPDEERLRRIEPVYGQPEDRIWEAFRARLAEYPGQFASPSEP